MPIYEYQCPNCQKVFEEWTHVTDMQAQERHPLAAGHVAHVFRAQGRRLVCQRLRLPQGHQGREQHVHPFFFRLLVDEFHFFRQHCQQHFRRLGFFHLLFVDPFRVRYL